MPGVLHARCPVSTVTFVGGEVTLDLRIGPYFYTTEPSVFVGASGSIDGVSFEQFDYFSLVYASGHHHFEQNYAVLFETPIGDACGLRTLVAINLASFGFL